MTEVWTRAVEVAADTLGEMLLESAAGDAVSSYEKLAAAVLKAGLSTVRDWGPSEARTAAVAAAIHEKLHGKAGAAWSALTSPEKAFWLDMAREAIAASDQALLDDIVSSNTSDKT
jgi:hypothetical protein